MITREEYDVFTASTRQKRLEWFKDARFGMFIHYGLYSIDGMGEWAMYSQNMDISDYEKLAERFRPAEN
jgi:alpha-L-fucosidase